MTRGRGVEGGGGYGEWCLRIVNLDFSGLGTSNICVLNAIPV